MTEFYLIRHAVNDFVKTGRLAGWTPDVHLNEDGRAQAAALGERLAKTRIDFAYSSPLERCMETAQAVLQHHPELTLHQMDDLGEVRYGTWQGAELGKLSQRKLWRAVQINPTRARFPGGESMRGAQMRAVNAIEALAEQHPRARVAVFSHSDIIKMILAHYMGLHLDLFQRIDVSPASISIIRLWFARPMIVQINESSYLPEPKREAPDVRAINEVRPVNSIVVDAVGKPGERVFWLQVTGTTVETAEPVSFVMEKTQALMLARQIDDLFVTLGPDLDVETQPGDIPALAAPESMLFRAGKFTLQYDHDSSLVCITLEEMLGADQGTPRTIRLWATRRQIKALGKHARQVAQRGRDPQHT